jgi:hypothetical protein
VAREGLIVLWTTMALDFNYIYNAANSSETIFTFLNSTFTGPNASENGMVTNWTELCSDNSTRFQTLPNFIGCLLYSNVTRDILDGTLGTVQGDTNLTALGFTSVDVASAIWSSYLTCLPIYTASFSSFSKDNGNCTVGQLLTGGYELSAQGVGTCVESLCSGAVQVANPDIAGIGVCLLFNSEIGLG